MGTAVLMRADYSWKDWLKLANGRGVFWFLLRLLMVRFPDWRCWASDLAW